MAKYIDADRLKEEFQKRFDICKRVSEDDKNALDMQDWYRGKYTAYSECLSFIDSLSEEPDKSLEEAAEEYAIPWDLSYFEKGESLFNCYGIADAFKAGAEWMKAEMMEEAVEASVNTYELIPGGSAYVEFVADMPVARFRSNDKVRIIIVKEESK